MPQIQFKLPRPVKGDRAKFFGRGNSTPCYFSPYKHTRDEKDALINNLKISAMKQQTQDYVTTWCILNGLKV